VKTQTAELCFYAQPKRSGEELTSSMNNVEGEVRLMYVPLRSVNAIFGRGRFRRWHSDFTILLMKMKESGSVKDVPIYLNDPPTQFQS
jgi:hypothetical protein